MYLSRVGEFIIRNKFRIVDFSAVMLITAGVIYGGLTFDIFANGAGHTPRPEALELDEMVAISGIFLLGLVWAVRRLRRERREIARRAAVESEIRQLAFHDPLTGLPNRRLFDDALKAAAASPPGTSASHGVFMLDLNKFKRINDAFGHPVGDEVLIQVGARITTAVRDGDLVARLGGDEFAVLATHISGAEAATGLALRIVEALKLPIPTGGGDQVVGVAIGIALMPQDGNDPTELLRRADIALYRAKVQGQSALRFFEEEMDVHVRERDNLERRMRKAITADAIKPFYQPMIDLKTGQIKGFEALARWNDVEQGDVAPERFIPLAEDCGLIAALTDRLITQACTDAKTWPANIELAVNISPVLFSDPGFGLKVLGVLDRTGFSPHRLELEITESAMVRDLGAAQTALSALRNAGIRIALDDFGTGYSSLYHLRNFQVDRIKIDRSFVSAMSTDKNSAAIVKALVGLGAGLGLDVTAEGVETIEQQHLLAAQGCEQGQGFLYSQAVPANEALALFGAEPQWVDERGAVRA